MTTIMTDVSIGYITRWRSLCDLHTEGNKQFTTKRATLLRVLLVGATDSHERPFRAAQAVPWVAGLCVAWKLCLEYLRYIFEF